METPDYNKELDFVTALEASVTLLEQEVRDLKMDLACDPDEVASRVACHLLGQIGLKEPLSITPDTIYGEAVGQDRQSIINRHLETWRRENMKQANRLSKG